MSLPITIIVPVYNEKESIKSCSENLISTMKNYSHPYEIIFVDDCSTDGSLEIIEKIKAENLRIIMHPVNKGYGASIKTGIKNSKYEIVGIVDIDGTYPINRFPDLISFMDKFDMVVGARTGKFYLSSFFKQPLRYIYLCLVNYITGKKIPDVNSGFRVLKKELIEGFISILGDRFSFTTSLTLLAIYSGYSVKFLSIEYYKRIGKSKVLKFRDTLGTFQILIQISMYFDPVKVLLIPASLILFIGFTSGILFFIFRYPVFILLGYLSLLFAIFIVLLGFITKTIFVSSIFSSHYKK